MKVTVTMDCTPEEARTFFGLPDVKPLQQAMLLRMGARMEEAEAALSPEAILRTWLGALSATPDQMREWMTTLMTAGFRAPAVSNKE